MEEHICKRLKFFGKALIILGIILTYTSSYVFDFNQKNAIILLIFSFLVILFGGSSFMIGNIHLPINLRSKRICIWVILIIILLLVALFDMFVINFAYSHTFMVSEGNKVYKSIEICLRYP